MEAAIEAGFAAREDHTLLCRRIDLNRYKNLPAITVKLYELREVIVERNDCFIVNVLKQSIAEK